MEIANGARASITDQRFDEPVQSGKPDIIAGAKKAAIRLVLMAASKKRTRNTEIEKHGSQVELKTAP
jgi:hypothetical protein